PTATLEIARTALLRATRRIRDRRFALRAWPIAQAFLWFSLGVTLSIGASIWLRHATAYPPPLELPKPEIPGAPAVAKIIPAPAVDEAPSPAPPPAAAPPVRR